MADFSDNALWLNLTGANKRLQASTTIGAGGVNVLSNTFTITAAAASQLVFSTQPGGGTAHAVWGTQPVVQVRDIYGNVVTSGADSTVNIVLTLSTGSGTLAGTATLAAVAGQAAFTNLYIDSAGSKKLTATAAGLAQGSTSQVSSSFTITPAAATTCGIWYAAFGEHRFLGAFCAAAGGDHQG